MTNQHPSFEELEKVREEYLNLERAYWYQHDLFSFDWWFLLILSIIPWIVWWKLVDEKRMLQILLYGLFVAIESALLNITLTNLMVWGYQNKLFHLLSPVLFPYDFTMMPVVYMLVYQMFVRWSTFLIANIFISAIFTFGVEPLLEWMKIYKEYNFPSLYSFSLYYLIAIVSKWIVDRIVAKSIR